MTKLNRRQFMATTTAAAAFTAVPSMSASTGAVPFVKPTTNILYMGARYGGMYGFTNSEIVQILDVDKIVDLPEGMEDAALESVDGYYDGCGWDGARFINNYFGDSLDSARALAENGDDYIYRRAQALDSVRGRLNEHFSFKRSAVREWMGQPNPHLGGETFRSLMVRDIEQAAELVDFALTGKEQAETAS